MVLFRSLSPFSFFLFRETHGSEFSKCLMLLSCYLFIPGFCLAPVTRLLPFLAGLVLLVDCNAPQTLLRTL